MGKSFSFEVKGLKGLQNKLKKLPSDLREDIRGELQTFAQSVVRDAKSAAPKDKGALAQSINYVGNDLNYTIIERAKYSPYQEFGTGSKVRVDAEFSAYAGQFKGRGKRKHNMAPKPHLFPAFVKHRPNILRNINAAIKRSLNK